MPKHTPATRYPAADREAALQPGDMAQLADEPTFPTFPWPRLIVQGVLAGLVWGVLVIGFCVVTG